MTDSIPCEYCYRHISPDAYQCHAERCQLYHYHQDVVIPISQMITSNDVDSDNIEDMDDVEAEDDLDRYITSSQQVQGNLRTFLSTHFNRVNSLSPTPGSSPPNASNRNPLLLTFRLVSYNLLLKDKS